MIARTVRHAGRIHGWNDERGFGFVTPNGGGDAAFVHVKAFERRGRRPLDGDLVSYAPARDSKGRLNATGVRFAVGAGAAPGDATRRHAGSRARAIVAMVFLMLIGAGWALASVASVVPLAYAAMSAVTFLAYAIDKSAARSDRRRTPESALHLLALLCGWPGALLAQAVLRHKSTKPGFQSMFRVTVVINCAALAWLLAGKGPWSALS